MPKVIILGTSNAVPSKDHENTHMVILGRKRTILVDCVSNPIIRLEQAGVNLDDLTDIVITHFHPDHVSGIPLLLMDMWLLGRTKPLNIYGLHYTLDRLEGLMGFYGWAEWPNFFSVGFFQTASDRDGVRDGLGGIQNLFLTRPSHDPNDRPAGGM